MVEKIKTDQRLPRCPNCKFEPELQRNAGGRFRVKCTNCKESTEWVNKTEAILRWSYRCIDVLKQQNAMQEYYLRLNDRTIKSLTEELKQYKF